MTVIGLRKATADLQRAELEAMRVRLDAEFETLGRGMCGLSGGLIMLLAARTTFAKFNAMIASGEYAGSEPLTMPLAHFSDQFIADLILVIGEIEAALKPLAASGGGKHQGGANDV